MGDVMLLVPVLRAFGNTYPDAQITVVTRPRFATFFASLPGVKVFEADVDGAYSGVLGMRDLFRALMKKGSYDLVLDLHDHIRTMMLRSMFKLFGTPVIVFDKGRKEKKAFTQREHKITEPLPHTVDRYAAAFAKAGLPVSVTPPPYLTADDEATDFVKTWLEERNLSKQEPWLGIAPFAMHVSKIWPVHNYKPLLEQLLAKRKMRFFFFGGGEKEVKFFEDLRNAFPDHCVLVAGQMKMKHEIALMPYLDLMLCVDSSNMHLAALSGTPLLSIWGGTHPALGFSPYGVDEKSIVQVPASELTCRPCSVYGKETCYRGDFACLNSIKPEAIVEQVSARLK